MTDILVVDGHGPALAVARAFADLTHNTVRPISIGRGAADFVDRFLTELGVAQADFGVIAVSSPLGDSDWAILQRAHKPVVVVPTHAEAPRTIGRALVPLDGSAEAASAAATTIQMLARAGVDIVILHVFNAETVPRFWDQPSHANAVWEDEFLARYCSQPGTRIVLRNGVAGEHVLAVAADECVDLIALGWSHHLDAGRAVTFQQTVQEARVPVLVLPID